MNPVLEQAPPSPPTLKMVRRQVFPVTLREIPYGYRPGRGLGLSIIAHQLTLLLIVLFGRYAFIQPTIAIKPQIEASRSTDILVLPTLGGGSEGIGKTGGGAGDAGKLSSGLRAQSRRGFAYPGPQPIVSNPPQATLGIQTILQPSLKNLPRLRRYVPLPNIVQPPPAAPEVASKEPAMVVKTGGLSFRHPAETSVAAPKITLPLSDNKVARLLESKPVLPKKAVPAPVEASDVSGVSRDKKGLLVLNAVPPPPDVSNKIPRAEARSLFAVSPGDATVIAEPAAGTRAGGQASMAAGSGSRADIARGDALAEIAAGGEGGKQNSPGSGTGSGGHYGNAQGKGLNAEAGSGGTGRGTGNGPGLGTGSATGAGSGSGAGSAPGGGGFPGITIQGGRYGNTNVANVDAKVERRPKSYNMTIVSTSNSGGGLPDLGVFHDEKVYTVYLDMRANDEDPAPSWTLQYSVLQPVDPPGVPVQRITGTPTPPYAMLKELPELTPALERKCGRRLIIASAIMETSGKLDQVSIKQSPDVDLVAPITEALKHWIFEPAQIDGQPVALKILLGIRLAIPR